MIITVSDFARITGVPRDTIYSWFYRGVFPEGIESSPILGKSKVLKVTTKSKYYKAVKNELIRM